METSKGNGELMNTKDQAMQPPVVTMLKQDRKLLPEVQYQALLALFNECNEDFWVLPQATQSLFFDRLYAK